MIVDGSYVYILVYSDVFVVDLADDLLGGLSDCGHRLGQIHRRF